MEKYRDEIEERAERFMQELWDIGISGSNVKLDTDRIVEIDDRSDEETEYIHKEKGKIQEGTRELE